MPVDEEAVFHAARALPAGDPQNSYLSRACGGDEPALRRLQALLRIYQASAATSDTLVSNLLDTDIRTPPDFPRIESYEILEQIGEGGFGYVFRAQQTQPLRRQVAIKLLKPGMDSREVLARFDAERQALAVMSHPGIAGVFDAGTTTDGRPYFVMELVQGRPITDYCDQAKLSLRQRLELFATVCQAVQHAHQRGIIHRDLKPGNVLVALHDGAAVPKVIDFGIAKAISQPLGEQSIHTRAMQLIGTPLYMSPEQAEAGALDIDTRSDVYSLGVLLYELLTGATPFDKETLRAAGDMGIRRIIREDEPPVPSQKASSLSNDRLSIAAQQRGLDDRRLSQALRGELDWIVMKALEKDRDRRYESASSFAADVQRYLNHEPVEASPPSSWYQVRKYVVRNRALLGTTTVIALALLTGTGVSLWQAYEANIARGLADTRYQGEQKARKAEARIRLDLVDEQAKLVTQIERADQAADQARSVLNFFQFRVLAAARPEDAPGGLGVDASIRAALDAAEPEIAVTFKGQPLAEASIRETFGTTYFFLGEGEAAIKQQDLSLQLRRQYLPADDLAILRTMHNLAAAYRLAGRLDEALLLFEQTVERKTAVLGSDHLETLSTQTSLGSVYKATGKFDGAVHLLEQTFDKLKQQLGPDNQNTLEAMNSLASAYTEAGLPLKAFPLYEDALRRSEAKHGPDHFQTLTQTHNLATAYQAAGKLDRALPLFEAGVEKIKLKLGPEHPDLIKATTVLAGAYVLAGRVDEALTMLQATLATSKAKLGPDHPHTLVTMGGLADAYKAARKLDVALLLYEETLEKKKTVLGEDHPEALRAMNNLAMTYLVVGKRDQGVPLLEESLRFRRLKLGDDHPDTLISMNNLGLEYGKDGKFDAAIALIQEAVEGSRKRLGDEHERVFYFTQNLASINQRAQKLETAVLLYRDALQRSVTLFGNEHAKTLRSIDDLAHAYELDGKLDDAIEQYEQALQLSLKKPGADHKDTFRRMNNLGVAYNAAGRSEQARSILEQAYEKEKSQSIDEPVTMSNLALAYKRLGQTERATSLYQEGLANARVTLKMTHPTTQGICQNLADCYDESAQPEKAEPLWRELVEAAKGKSGADSPPYASRLTSLGLNLINQHRAAEAEEILRQALEIRERKDPEAWTTFNTRSILGGALAEQKKYQEAEPLLLSGYEGIKERPAPGPQRLSQAERLQQAVERLVKFYADQEMVEQAEVWRTRLAAQE